MASSGIQEMEINDPSGLVWVNHSGTDAVPDAVYAGRDAYGQEVYVGRSLLSSYLVVGKFVPGSGGDILQYSGTPPAPFQVLTNPKQVQFKWALAELGKYPPTAVQVGSINVLRLHGNIGKYYIGRTKQQGNTFVGGVWSSGLPSSASVVGQATEVRENQLCYCVNGSVHFTEDYEILLAKPMPSCQCEMHYRLPLNCSNSCPKKK